MRRFPWEWLLGLGVGFSVGLLYAWVVSPVRYTDTTPDTLRADFKDQFRTTISAAYAATGNLPRARARLGLLGDPDSIQALSAEAQQMLAAGGSFEAAQDIARLATDLQAGVASILPPPTAPPLPPEAAPSGGIPVQATAVSTNPAGLAGAPMVSPTATAAVTATATPRPTRTPVPTAAAPFEVASQERVCSPDLADGLLQITVLDGRGHPLPGIKVTISWSSGEEQFFTGLKPDIGEGYADFRMESSTTYSLLVGGTGTPVRGLSAPACSDSAGQTYTGGLRLTFQQP